MKKQSQSEVSQCCQGCAFSELRHLEDGLTKFDVRICRRYPPGPVGWIKVSDDDWCGEFRAAEKTERA